MVTRRTLGLGVVWVLVWAPAAWAQGYLLTEVPRAGECFRVEIDTTVSGTVKVPRDDAAVSIPLKAENRLALLQRTLAVRDGEVTKAARVYQTAESRVRFGDDTFERTLRDERRLIVAQATDDGPVCYSPAGPLTQDEVELTGDHFDTLHLTRLLPGKSAERGESWKADNAAVQALCSFDGLISHDLTVTLEEVKDGAAWLRVKGQASGIELGALVNLTIDAKLKYELLPKRLTELEWKQTDRRDAGPVSPALEAESVTKLRRTLLPGEPKELSDLALVTVPKEGEPPALLCQVVHEDTGGGFRFLHARDWHVVGRTEKHLILRLLERGDFVAQATLTRWEKAEPGKHIAPEEFRELIAQTPGWEPEELIEEGEVPTESGRWVYRVTARGSLHGVPVLQNFFAVAGPGGEQVMVTFVMKPANAAKVGTRDVALVNSIDFK
ncbi:MAG TPA: hypothetical protein VIL46_03775 [Gemmataceae bacterium]